MTRRHFMRFLFQSTLGAAFFGLPSACASRSANHAAEGSGALAYRPLDGRNMRDLARRKVHHGGDVFHNPFSDVPKGRLSRVLQWKWFSKNHFKSYYPEELVTPVALDHRRILAGRGLEITFVKHAGILIKDKDAFLLVDPVFDGLLWFIEDFSPLISDPAQLPQPKHILVTHGHYDHLDTNSLRTWGDGTHLISPLGYHDIYDGIGMRRRQHLDWYERYQEDGREITFLPSNHWTMRNPLIGPNTGLWGGYLVRTKSGAVIYISGDSGYFDGFEQIGAEFDIDLAIFNLGAYEPRWFMAPSHMNPEETVRAFRELNARHLAIVHWGTFRLGDEPVHFPPQDIRAVLRKQKLEERFLEIKHGQTMVYA
jgi:L-ascorbate metabolism protein UlaG (beta-lactamase superfamily)